MKQSSEEHEQEIRTIHNGKFYFSTKERGRHPSYCHLKVLQGKYKTLVILSQPQGHIGTGIVNAIQNVAAQVVNLFGLDPATTLYLQYTPPTVPTWLETLDEDDLLANLPRSALGPSDEKYERITIHWVESDAHEPVLERYRIAEFPDWNLISPGDAANYEKS